MFNPNVWRKIRYEDDGMSSFQCLSCKQIWYMADHQPYKFCPFCGTKWDKQLDCVTKGTPRWHARLLKLNPDANIFEIEYDYNMRRYNNREIIEVWGTNKNYGYDKHPYVLKEYSYTNNRSIAGEIFYFADRYKWKVTAIKTKKGK